MADQNYDIDGISFTTLDLAFVDYEANHNYATGDNMALFNISITTADTDDAKLDSSAGGSPDIDNHPLITPTSGAGHEGIWSTSKQRLTGSPGSQSAMLEINEDFVQVKGLQIEVTGSGTSDECIEVFSGANSCLIEKCIIKVSGSGSSQDGIYTGNVAVTNVNVFDCLLEGNSTCRSLINAQNYSGSNDQTWQIEHNTFIGQSGGDNGLAGQADAPTRDVTMDAWNCISLNNGTDYWANGANFVNGDRGIIASDTSATGEFGTGTYNHNSVTLKDSDTAGDTVLVESLSTPDYQLKDGVTGTHVAIGTAQTGGVRDSRADTTLDIAGNSRPTYGSGDRDMGCFQHISVGTLTASGTPILAEITAVGTVIQTQVASGGPSIASPTASGISTIIKKATGTVVVAAVVASGVSGLGNLTSDGTPNIEEITATGVSKIIKKSDGTVTLAEIIAAGVASFAQDSSGTPNISEIIASGIATIFKKGSGALVIEEITALGVVDQIQKPSGAPSIEVVSASGVSKIIKKATGAVTLAEIEASGLAGLAGTLSSSGNPSIEEITAAGTVIQTQKLSGALSVEEIIASGVSTIVSAVNPASGTPSIVAIKASGVSALNVIPSTTPTTRYEGGIDLDLARPGDIEDPATDRAIDFLHDAVEKLAQDVPTAHDNLNDITPNQHHNQVHGLYGEDHEDVSTTEELETGSVLTYIAQAEGGNSKFEAKNVFVSRGYGGIENTSGPSLSDLGAGWQVVPADAILITTPAGVTQDHANDAIALDSKGIWNVGILISLTHNESNAGRTFDIQIYNSTDAVELGVIPVPIGRNQPGTLISLNLIVEIPATSIEGDLIQLRIGNGDTVTSVVLVAYQFSATHISEFIG